LSKKNGFEREETKEMMGRGNRERVQTTQGSLALG
jgi:hypothetical protein